MRTFAQVGETADQAMMRARADRSEDSGIVATIGLVGEHLTKSQLGKAAIVTVVCEVQEPVASARFPALKLQ